MTDLTDILQVTDVPVCPKCGQEWELYETDVPLEYGGGFEKVTRCCDVVISWSPRPFRSRHETS